MCGIKVFELRQSSLKDIPDLGRVVVGTPEHFDRVARCGVSVSQVKAFTLVDPYDNLVNDSELLVCVALDTGEDLHLLEVLGGTVGYIEALVTEDTDIIIIHAPRLAIGPDTVLNSDSRVVAVARGRQADTCVLGRGDHISERNNRVGDIPPLGSCTSAVKDFSWVSIGVTSVFVVQALSCSAQGNSGRAGGPTNDPLLIRVTTGALEDLYLVTVGGIAIVIQAYRTKDRESVTLGGP